MPIVIIDKLDEYHLAFDTSPAIVKARMKTAQMITFVRPDPARFRRIRCGLRTADFFEKGKGGRDG
jgi:hypothetical protein